MSRVRNCTLALLVVALHVSAVQPAHASTSVLYDFNSAGDLAASFNSYVPAGNTASQSSTGGLSNTGAIAAAQGTNTSAVFASKATYSMGPVGSTYTFSSFIQSLGSNGYSGMGFTTLVPSAGNTVSGPPFRPSDALGISVHGGGFVFHNGATDFNGNWDGSNLSTGVTVPTPYNNGNFIGNGGNSPDSWYKVVLVITRDSSTTFDMHVEVTPSSSTGTLLNANPLAVVELNNQAQATLLAAPSFSTYINFSGDRVYFFDNYQVSLAGGSSIIQAGAPVVLTSSASSASNVVTVSGDVTGNGGATVTERGFVYASSSSPTISDTKVVVGSGNGTYSGVTPALSNGTYYFRAFATNATGTSYGSEETLTLSSATTPSPTTSASASATPSPSSTSASALTSDDETTLAQTGFSANELLVVGLALLLTVIGVMVFSQARTKDLS